MRIVTTRLSQRQKARFSALTPTQRGMRNGKRVCHHVFSPDTFWISPICGNSDAIGSSTRPIPKFGRHGLPNWQTAFRTFRIRGALTPELLVEHDGYAGHAATCVVPDRHARPSKNPSVLRGGVSLGHADESRSFFSRLLLKNFTDV